MVIINLLLNFNRQQQKAVSKIIRGNIISQTIIQIAIFGLLLSPQHFRYQMEGPSRQREFHFSFDKLE